MRGGGWWGLRAREYGGEGRGGQGKKGGGRRGREGNKGVKWVRERELEEDRNWGGGVRVLSLFLPSVVVRLQCVCV